jgi:DinB family protein
MPPTTNYSKYLGDQEPLAAIRRNIETIRTLTRPWTPDRFERSYAPGKWTARQVLTHLAQTELALGTRARMSLSTPNYAAQRFDQDDWIARETRLTGPEAVETFAAIARFNLALFEGLSPSDRQIAMSHPEYGSITVDWIIHLLPGHQLHHLEHLKRIAA